MNIKSKARRLYLFCKFKGIVSKSEIMKWGLDNYFISAPRVVRKFVEDRLMRKLSKDECVLKGFRGKQAWYEVKEVGK